MIQDKNFKLFLIDGTAQGKIRCTTDNWAGVALKIPKTQMENCAEILELNHAGIYFLFSESEVYIGAGKFKSVGNFWDDAIFFTNFQNSLDSSSLNFLKNKFSQKITAANRYKVKNDAENIIEETASPLDFFASYVETILYIFGYKIFEPPKEISAAPQIEHAPIFYIERIVKGKKIIAMCQKFSNKFVVLKGSQLAPKLSKDMGDNIKSARKDADIENNILQEDFFLDSASAAAKFVTGVSTNGRKEWKTKAGTTLGNFLDSQPAEEQIFHFGRIENFVDSTNF